MTTKRGNEDQNKLTKVFYKNVPIYHLWYKLATLSAKKVILSKIFSLQFLVNFPCLLLIIASNAEFVYVHK